MTAPAAHALQRLWPRPPAAPLILCIMDGIGLGQGDGGDAVAQADTPVFDALARSPLAAQLQAHGPAVGMPQAQDMGNSEVGHNAMGAGRIIAQGAARAGQAIADGSLFAGPSWQQIVAAARPGTLHLLGLLSDGNVHSHIDHLLAIIERALLDGVRRIRIHVLLDGRDVARTSADRYIAALERALGRHHGRNGVDARIGSGGGRMQLTMDRYGADWPMVARGWQVHVAGRGRGFASAQAAIERLRQEADQIGDQDLPGFVIDPTAPAGGRPEAVGIGAMQDGDAVVAFNFRGDRMLQWCQAMEAEAMPHFDRAPRPQLTFAGMTQYDGDLQLPRRFLVPAPRIDHTLSELLCGAGVRQLAISETQKFGHVTYFWSGNRSGGFDRTLETAIEVPSHPPPFDGQPAMAAPQIVERCLMHLQQQPCDFARINLANGDMVGHTGNFAATVAAVACVDACIGRLQEWVEHHNGLLVVTGDHGNADDMVERDPATGAISRDAAGRPLAKTSHSINPVPLWIAGRQEVLRGLELAGLQAPGLANLAATLATLMGFAPPEHMLPAVWRWRPQHP